MCKKVLFLFLFILMVQFGFGQSDQSLFSEFNKIVDFSVTFEDLYRYYTLKQGSLVTEGKILIIDGSIASRTVIEKDEAGFTAELEVVNGEWVGLEDVEIYKCFVILRGPDFFSRIPVKRSRNKLPNEIEVNSHVLIVGRILGTRADREGNTIPVMEAAFVRAF